VTVGPSGKPMNTANDSWPVLAREALHGLAGDFVRAIGPYSEADPVALLGQLLVVFGNCIGRGAHFLAEADKHFTNLFLVLAGLTAKGRKGTSYGRVRGVFTLVDEAWIAACEQHGLSSGEGLIWAVRDAIEKKEPVKQKGKTVDHETVVADQGVDDKRCLVSESEFAQCLRVLGREGNTLSPVVRTAWDTGTLSTMVKNSPARATGAHISIIGHITREEALRYLDRTEAANGFGNRFLWLCVRRSKVLPEGGAVPPEMIQELAARLAQAAKFARGVTEVRRDWAARDLWIAVYAELSEGRPGLLGAITARAEAQVMRLALVYALLGCSSVIRREHLLAGLSVWAYAEDSAAYIFGSSLGDPVADEILRALRATKDGLTRTQIRDLFGRNRGKDDIGRALSALLAQGQVRLVERPSQGAGRPAEVWIAVEPRPGAAGIRSWRSFLSYPQPDSSHESSDQPRAEIGTTETTESRPGDGNDPSAPASPPDPAGPSGTTETTETTNSGAAADRRHGPATTETTCTTEFVDPVGGPCRSCGEARCWRLRAGGPWTCARCHPPGPPSDQVELAGAGA